MRHSTVAGRSAGILRSAAFGRKFRLVAGLSFALLAATAGVGHAQDAAGGPTGFMTKLGDKVIQLIGNQKQPEAQRKQQFAQLVNQSFDMDGIARFVLGRYWRTASAGERQQFNQVFDRYMIDVYWVHFNQYTGQRFVVTKDQPVGDGTTLVSSQIVQPSGQQPVSVVWRVAKRDSQYRITDVSIEGVSELVTYRQEFGSVISANGGSVESLITQLRQKAQQLGG